jgi:hypothetical protein
MLALGTRAPLSNGADPVDWLFAEYAVPVDIGGEILLDFPEERPGRAGKRAIRVEPHTDLLLKALARGGESPDRVVEVRGGTYTLGHLWRASAYRAWVAGDQTWTTSWNDTPWTLMGLAAWAPPHWAWTADGGHAMDLDRFVHASEEKLHAEHAFVRDAMAEGRPVEKSTKGKVGIHQYTCGGLHFLQGVGYAIARGNGSDEDRRLLQQDIDATFYRYDGEMAQLDALIKERPDAAAQLLTQRLKFTGHFLETTHELAAMDLYVPTDAQRQTMNRAAADLAVTAEVMERVDLWTQLPALKAGDDGQYQLYLDMVGDAAHGVRGLDLATGSGTVKW